MDLTKEKIKALLTTESLRKEEFGEYVLTMIQFFARNAEKKVDGTQAHLLRLRSDLGWQFMQEGLGAMALAYMANAYKDVDMEDVKVSQRDAEIILNDFRENQDTLKTLDEDGQIEFAVNKYASGPKNE